MRFPQVVRDLLAARDRLAACGLAKDGRRDALGRVCALGAIWDVTEPRNRDWWPVAEPLDAVVPGPGDADDVLNWNDAPERTQAEVLAAFDEAASLALSEAQR